MVPLTVLTITLCSLPHQTDLLHSWILVLHSDVLLLQETWDLEAVAAQLPDYYQLHASQVSGPGAACVIACCQSHVPASNHTLGKDCIDWLAVLLPMASHGTTLAVRVHFCPRLSFVAQRHHLQHSDVVHLVWVALFSAKIVCFH